MSDLSAISTDAFPSKQALRLQVRRLLDEDAEDDDMLMDFGLTSIGVMQLITEWRQRDIEVDFLELADRLTLNGIWDLLSSKASSGAAPTRKN